MKSLKALTEGNIYKNFFLYAVPLILAALFSQAYNTIDAAIAGKYISDYALGAIGATSAFLTMLNTTFAGFAVGFSIFIARLFGQGEYARMKRDTVNVLLFLAAAILLTTGLCLVLREPLFAFLKVDAEIREDAMLYFTVIMAGYLPMVMNVVFVQILNALGVTGFSLYMSLLSAALNIGGNLLTVLVFDWGIVGIAASSIFSSAAATVCYVWKMLRAFRSLPSEKVGFHFSFSSIRTSLRYSLPTCLQQISMYFAGLVVSPFVNVLGAAATTGYSVAMRYYDICAQSYQNSSKAVSSYTAQSIGAGKFDRIRKGLFAGLIQGIVLLSPFVILCAVFARPIASIFFSEGYSGESMTYAVRFATLFLPFIFFNMINNLGHSFLRGMGSMKTLLFSTLLGSAVRIAATAILTPQMEMDGVYLAMVLSWVAEALLCLILFLVRYRTQDMVVRRAQKSL